MFLKYAKTIINEESSALKKLSLSLDKNFTKSVKKISSVKGNIVISGVGKSGYIAKK